MSMWRTAALVCGLTAGAAQAAHVSQCDGYAANAHNLSVPYDEAVREFANGRIVFLNLFVEEPVCCGAHLMVLFPNLDDYYQDCRLISWTPSLGYLNINLSDATAAYNPKSGLMISVPSRLYDAEANFGNGVLLDVTINQAHGTVTVKETLGIE